MIIGVLFFGLLMLAFAGLIAGCLLAFSGFAVSAAPLALALLLGISAKQFGFLVNFAFWFVLLYSLSSYRKLRKAVIFVSTSILGSSIVMLFFILLKGLVPGSTIAVFLIKLIVAIGFVFVGLSIDNGKEMVFCINIARVMRIPKFVQRLIAAYMYGAGIQAILQFSLLDQVKNSTLLSVLIGWIIPLLVGALAFYVDGVSDGDLTDKNGCVRLIKNGYSKTAYLISKCCSAKVLSEIKQKHFTYQDE